MATTNTGTALALPDTKELDRKAGLIVAEAREYRITSAPKYEAAAGFLKGCKALLLEIGATFDPIIRAQRTALDAARAAKEKHAAPVEEAEKIVKGRMAEWAEKEEAARRERERKAREVAEEEARRRQEEEAARIREEAARAKAEGDKRAAAALAAEAKAVENTPPVVAPVEVQSRRPVVEGVAVRKNWTAEVHDFPALVRYVAEHPEWIGLLKPDQVTLNRAAKAQREALALPGVRAVAETVIAAGA